MHPDTTVLDVDAAIYPASSYFPESDSRSIYHQYFASPDTMFPVWNRSEALDAKEVVLGVAVGESRKAYPVSALQQKRVINDIVGDELIVVIASASTQAARVYERGNVGEFSASEDPTGESSLPSQLTDPVGVAWNVTEDYLVNAEDESMKLERVPTHMSFWFGWFASYPDTEVYTVEAR